MTLRPMETIGDVAREGRLLEVECRNCWHIGHHRARDVAVAVGFNKPLGSIKFKRGGCGRKDVKVKTVHVDPDRPPKVTVWVPMKFKP
jgi:hypothetical protein